VDRKEAELKKSIVTMSFRKDLENARKKVLALDSNIADTPHGKIEYVRSGKGVVILVSHGMTGGVDQGLGMVNDFIGHKYDIICVSRFGYLKTPLPEDGSPKAQADTYAHLLDHLGIDRVVIFGNSAGGTSAIRFALQYPQRCQALILHSSNVPGVLAPSPPKIVMKIIFGSNVIYWLLTTFFLNIMMLMFVHASVKNQLTKEQYIHVKDIFRSSLPVNLRTKGILNDGYVSNPDINAGYPFHEIRVPTLIIHAMDDPVAKFPGAQELAQQIPEDTFIPFETGGHLTLGHEEEIKKIIADFISTNADKKS
jgi:pimeloyl-ACP methyl ester carboxylesterase